jgi:hypothetical protein
MPRYLPRVIALSAATSWLSLPVAANAAVSARIISGNAWVAYGVIVALVAIIYIAIRGALSTGGGGGSRDGGHHHGWFGFVDDDDENN